MQFKNKKNLLIGLVAFSLIFAGTTFVYAQRETISLTGAWRLGTGEQIPASFNYEVSVPGLVDLVTPFLSWQDEKYFWYKKTFTLSSQQKKPCAFIKIDQSQFGTEVYLNGQKLGSYIGCYTSHEYKADKAINYNGENTVLVRVGAKDTLSPDSAVGKDWERVSYIPGIWGDVSLYLTGEIKIENIQVIPQIETATALVKVTLWNLATTPQEAKVVIQVVEKKSGNEAGETSFDFHLDEGEEKIKRQGIKIKQMKLWSPDSPFLYTAKVKIIQNGKIIDDLTVNFGMREFEIIEGDFYLNKKRIVLKGSNIAFHRFLSDLERKDLVWDEEWIKKLLIDIPKEHNFNFFRNHLGQMYNRWYDIADEYGMLLQNEWAFWSLATGTKEQIREEFTQWLKDNWNHPSIIIWDALNEPTYDYPERLPMINFVKYDVVSEMKKLDPTRPWEPTDFEEIHPYVYSVHSVLGAQIPGGLDFIRRIEQCEEPVALNEYIYFWIDKEGKVSDLTKDVVLRWLGEDSSFEERLEFQAFLATELTELWRRMEVDEIAPFVYLSVNEGATSHWFMGNIKDLRPKPILAALKNVFSPFGVSIELWDRHFFTSERRKIKVYLFNDKPFSQKGQLICRIVDINGDEVRVIENKAVSVEANAMKIEDIKWEFPNVPGAYYLEAKLMPKDTKEKASVSRKIAYVFEDAKTPEDILSLKIMVYDPDNEIKDYLVSKGLRISDFDSSHLSKQDILIVGEGALLERKYRSHIREITDFVKSGKTLIVIEPSYNIQGKQEVEICNGVSVTVKPMPWRGNESYVFFEDGNFSLWRKVEKEHLKMFNGGWGGEIVSEYDIIPPLPFKIEASCGLKLAIPAVIETYLGDGLIVISRIQIRERLLDRAGKPSDLYSRRVDPVAQQYLLNLLATYRPGSRAIKQILTELKNKKVIVRKVEASSAEGVCTSFSAVDGDMSTRWSSHFSDPQWIKLDLGEIKDVYGIKLHWEAACAREYEIQISKDSKRWETIFYTRNGNGGADFIKFKTPLETRYLKMSGIKRATEWGYSLWEFEVFLNKNELPAENSLCSEKIIKPLKPISVKASSIESSEYAASRAVDGNAQTRWSSGSDSDNQWLVLDFGEPRKISKVVLNWETAFSLVYKIQTSNDNKNWHDIFTTDAGDGGIDKIELKESVKARYIRFLGIKRGTEWGYSLWEFEIYSPQELRVMDKIPL